MKKKYFKICKVLGVVLFILTLINANAQTVITVTKTGDPNPFVYPYNYIDSQCDTVMLGTLQWAIRKANDSPDTCVIAFNIPGSGQHIILLSYELPSFSKPVTIDGTTQQGYQFGHPVIIIDGGGQIATGLMYYITSGQEVKGLQVQNFWMQGIFFWGCNGGVISDNVINRIFNGPSNYAAFGIRLNDVQGVSIKGNFIGTDFTGSSGIGCKDYGIQLSQSPLVDGNNVIGGAGINEKNVIAFNGINGIWIAQSLKNRITRNPIYNNPVGIQLVQSANNLKLPPAISSYTSNTLSGTSQPNDVIEIFGSTGDQNANEFITSTTANTSGNWTINITATYPYFIATATDQNNNTSTLSLVFPTGLSINPLSVSYTVNDATCNGANNGSISVVALGGVPPYTYQWNNGQTTPNITGLAAGTYTITVTDSTTATVTATAIINEPPIDTFTNPTACSELFISEYVEGTAHNTALEFYNPSENPIILNRYFVRVFMNGAPTPLITQLSGILLPKQTFVIANPNANAAILAIANQTSNKINFNGDDAIQIIKVLNDININIDSIEGLGQNPHDIFDTLHLDTLDQIGITDVIPGNGSWTVGNNGSTKNSTIIRNFGVSSSQSDWDCGRYQWQTLPQDDVTDLGQHQNICEQLLTNDISFSFANPTETGTNPKYFEFDIMVQANNNSTYFDVSVMNIAYNTTAFGDSIVANNNVTITKGANFNTVFNATTYIDPNSYITDDSTSVMKVPFGTDLYATSWNRTLVTTTPDTLLHVKIEIQTCNEYSLINFTDTGVFGMPMFSLYSLNASADPNTIGNHYDNTFYLNDLNQLLCPTPQITYFTSPVYPGTWYNGTTDNKWEMVINGIGFGASRGNGNVWFMNANDPENTDITQKYTLLNGNDFNLWTDNEIRIKMPSLIDTSIYYVNGKLIPRVPGSGNFYIKTNSGDSLMSATPVEMPYAIDNWNYIGKQRMQLANVANDSTTIIFRLSQNIVNDPNPMVQVAVKRAVYEWACRVQVNFIVDSIPTSINIDTTDGVNVIHFVNSFPSSTTLALTSISTGNCLNTNNVRIFFPTDIDIAILKDPATILGGSSWYFDTSGTDLPSNRFDFYEVAQHEVGHGVLLKHDIDLYSVLYWTSKFNQTSVIPQYMRRFPNANDVYGGEDVVAKSTSVVFNTDCATFPATTVDFSRIPCGQNSIAIIGNDRIKNFNIYPNPFNDDGFFISYEVDKNSFMQINIIDFNGKKVQQSENIKHPKGIYKEHIETLNFKQGIYFVVININGKMQTFKLIKL